MPLPPGYAFQGNAYYQTGEDCMGSPYSHWTMSAKTPHVTNPLILAYGGSEAEVQAKLEKACWADHDFRNLPDQARLAELIDKAKKNGRFYDRELIDVIEILARKPG